MKELTIKSKNNLPHKDDIKALLSGEELSKAKAAIIMVHGRGASAESILDLSQYFMFEGVSYIAPQAKGSLWYPLSFLAPLEQNEPGLSSSLQDISEIVEYIIEAGIQEQKIVLIGFSQGASLSLEWTARNAKNISAVFGLSGGLIGPPGTKRNYSGTFKNTTVFLGCSDVDFHIPKERVIESAEVFKKMNAKVTMKLYPNLGHTVNDDEIYSINSFIKNLVKG
jgi:predicted esterase